MKRKFTSVLMAGSLVVAGGAAGVAQPASASEGTSSANTTQTSQQTEFGMSDLKLDMERLAMASESLADQPGFGEFAYQSQLISEQHQMDLMAAWEKSSEDIEAGKDPHVVKNEFEDAYNRANAHAFNDYHRAKDMLMDELNRSGAPAEDKDKFADALNNTTAEMSAVLEEVKAAMNTEFNHQMQAANAK
jgi:hypothetical protein